MCSLVDLYVEHYETIMKRHDSLKYNLNPEWYLETKKLFLLYSDVICLWNTYFKDQNYSKVLNRLLFFFLEISH